ncbi:MAG: AmmeMemoRadiSam system radical SAM enzyme [Bacteroidales bacterium]|jgi:pyruvate formate lyase activating enzyme|nr:AmmeMemoRadiSam system radical SAM enzyme [Bacteroidales bacterium]
MENFKKDITKREFIKRCAAFSAGVTIIPKALYGSEELAEEQASGRKEAMFQEETARGIMCRICPNECVLKEGELSKCNNRKVIRSKLYTLAYGNPCSVNVDPIEKKPLYHFLPGSRAYSIATAGCNLVCLNCQNWTISQTSPDKTRNFSLPPEKVVSEAGAKICRSIAYTYSEPVTFYEYAYDTAVLAKKAGIKNVFKSNGYIYPEPLKKLCNVIDAANIDLKAFNEGTYLKLSGGKFQPVLDALKIYLDSGVWLEITNLVVPTWTDKSEEIYRMCKWLSENGFKNVPVHFSRFYPTYKLEQLPPTPVDILNKAAQIASSEGLNYVYTGNVPGSEISDTKCPGCKTTLIVRQGFRVAENSLKDGKCPKCGKSIDGVWN